MPIRYVLGQSFGFTRSASAVAAVPAAVPEVTKADIGLSLLGETEINGVQSIRFKLPAEYDLATHHLLVEIRFYAVPNGTQPPASAAEFVASAIAFSRVEASVLVAGDEVDVPSPDVPAGAYLGQSVLGFEG